MPYVKTKDGVDIYYEVSGEGTPFLFLSETACDGAVWKIYQVPEFARDHRVIIFDYRGTGLSGKPSAKYSTDVFADDAAAVMDHLGLEGAVVCGHSMGGRVAQLLALDHPRKVSKLILASSGAAHPGETGIPLRIAKEMVEIGYEKYVREHTRRRLDRSLRQAVYRPHREISQSANGQPLSGGVLFSPCPGAAGPRYERETQGYQSADLDLGWR
jgi:pimeloyl-ACP methyl ester carboxylesterase